MITTPKFATGRVIWTGKICSGPASRAVTRPAGEDLGVAVASTRAGRAARRAPRTPRAARAASPSDGQPRHGDASPERDPPDTLRRRRGRACRRARLRSPRRRAAGRASPARRPAGRRRARFPRAVAPGSTRDGPASRRRHRRPRARCDGSASCHARTRPNETAVGVARTKRHVRRRDVDQPGADASWAGRRPAAADGRRQRGLDVRRRPLGVALEQQRDRTGDVRRRHARPRRRAPAARVRQRESTDPGATTSGLSRSETGVGPADEKPAITGAAPDEVAPTVIASAELPGEASEPRPKSPKSLPAATTGTTPTAAAASSASATRSRDGSISGSPIERLITSIPSATAASIAATISGALPSRPTFASVGIVRAL